MKSPSVGSRSKSGLALLEGRSYSLEDLLAVELLVVIWLDKEFSEALAQSGAEVVSRLLGKGYRVIVLSMETRDAILENEVYAGLVKQVTDGYEFSSYYLFSSQVIGPAQVTTYLGHELQVVNSCLLKTRDGQVRSYFWTRKSTEQMFVCLNQICSF